MAIKYLKSLDLAGKRAFVRVDFNVPYDKSMAITDDTRITATLPTIRHCIENGARTILVSHLGRPDGKAVPSMSLAPVAERLSALLGIKVMFVDKPIGQGASEMLAGLKNGEVALLENIRFYPEEEKNDREFGKKLAELADVYINDAFAAAHRGHASNEAITNFIGECAAGFLLENEIEYFKKAMVNPAKPTTAIIGGVKISTKIAALKNILDKVDNLIIGGGMAYTFLKAKGYDVGRSILEADHVSTAKTIIELAEKNRVNLLLPVDIVVAPDLDSADKKKLARFDSMPADMEGVDIGPETIRLYEGVIRGSKTVVWNGPLGAFENPAFAAGTNAVAGIVAESGCLSVIGGGDSVSAINQSGYADKMSYISTGGGAFLELLEGKTLPAIKALDR
ncbi:MAG TPA: phosphoglycerate kinase [Spirochaetota bacterium]|nr:MAG: Phosphoglycerate kinase [Spirochaetes bacterium ADurb.BinA120]HPI14970.1 phosphoglycerate kinase [Spirochaetota bacterium]